MTDKQPAFIFYSDGTTEQKLPLPITFFEQASRMFAEQANRAKQQAMINPPPVADGND